MATASKFRYEVIPTQGGLQVDPTYDFQEVSDPDFVITETKEKEKFYYIKKVKSKLNLIKSDYDYILSRFGKCYKYYVRVYKICEEGEKFLIQCYFSDIDLEIDKDKCSIDVELEVDSPYNCFKNNGNKKVNVYGNTAQPLNVGLAVIPFAYRSMDWLTAILSVNAETQCCSDFGCFVSVRSDFFNWQPDGGGGTILVTDQAFTNYVNPLQPNYYIRIAAKSDIRNQGASNPATKLELSFNDVEDIMREIFNCFWVIEYIGGFPYLRWEHYSWFTRFMNYDALSATNFPFNEYKNKVKLDTDDIPAREFWKFMEAGTIDFVGVPLLYNEDCTNGEQKDRGIDYLTTDTTYIIYNTSSISNEGIVLIDCFETIPSTVWFAYAATGQLSAATIYNGRLSSANLQYDLHRHGRPLITGTMNNVPQTFLSIEPNVSQEDIIVQNCCADEFEKWKSSVKTEIGFGQIEEAEVDYKKEIIKFKLKHDSIG